MKPGSPDDHDLTDRPYCFLTSVALFSLDSESSGVKSAQITIITILSKKRSTPRKAGGMLPIGGEGNFTTLEGAAM